MASNYKYFINNKISELKGDKTFDKEVALSDLTPEQNKYKSLPYVITITNITTNNLTDVVLLGANQNLAPNVQNYGNSQFGIDISNPYAVVYSTGTSSVTYGELLYQTLNQPFSVDMIYIKGSTAAQANTVITLEHKDASGKLCKDPIVPLFDPYQRVPSAVISNRKFTVDGNTSLTIKNFYGRATWSLYIFPSEQINQRRVLNNESANYSIDVPKVANNNPIVISEKALKQINK